MQKKNWYPRFSSSVWLNLSQPYLLTPTEQLPWEKKKKKKREKDENHAWFMIPPSSDL